MGSFTEDAKRVMDDLERMATARCCDNGYLGVSHGCQKQPGAGIELDARTSTLQTPKPSKGGRPKGFDGTGAKMPSAIAQAFKAAGLDWKADFALAIKHNDRERIKLWLKLLPYLVTTGKRVRVRKWKGKASKAAVIALEAMEQEL